MPREAHPAQSAAAETVLVQSCATCGMVLDDGGEFHPYLFCLLKEAGRDPWTDFKWAVEQLGLKMPENTPLVRELRRIIDEHDDLVEGRLLERLDREEMLAEGLDWVAAREKLDA